ncbi:VOC family protein [Gordonia hydrophobica]|uniref:VOC family protein n=1 Tax=Gordonia hydrophobica TaxID=40516 RepID=A0ABZ2TWY2_9ACTN|nr:VOC family protein [Gordonia hydrophobica]MBM7366188.1 catechol 2,3-dioxygenase-like lactoylglutathione lyase family enzyme [Gordonia hydrophobica]
MEILSSRSLLISADPAALTAFYRDRLGLAVAREYPGGTVFHAGTGLIEIPAHLSDDAVARPTDTLWLQVRDIAAAHRELRDANVPIIAEPETKPWGLIEMTIADPDGRRLIVVEVPADHPLRRDVR